MTRFSYPLITASLLAILAAPVAADDHSGPAQQWVDHCTASELVTRRIDSLSASEVTRATELLGRGGMFEIFGDLGNDEACLTLAATAASNAPAIVLNFDREPGFSRGSEATLSNAIQKRLETLDVGYSVPDPQLEAGSPMLDLYRARPKDAKKAYWYTLVSNLKVDSRSVAGSFAGHCVILHDTSPFADFLRLRLRGSLSGHLTQDDTDWLARHGDAIEFWHEVSHCEQNTLKTYQGPHGAGGYDHPAPSMQAGTPGQQEDLLNRGTPAEFDITSLTEDQQGSQCSFAQSAFNTDNMGKVSPETLSIEDRKEISLGFLARLAAEVEADLYAQKEVAKRFGTGRPGCRDFQDIKTLDPWSKFRLSMSMLHPEFHYMTWLNPWLHNLSVIDQMQVALEAWEANMTVAFDRLEILHQSPLIRRIALRQAEAGVWDISGHSADSGRVENWELWLLSAFQSQSRDH